jgi:hypothetical protein
MDEDKAAQSSEYEGEKSLLLLRGMQRGVLAQSDRIHG